MKEPSYHALENQASLALRDYLLANLDTHTLLIMFSVLPKAEVARTEDAALISLHHNLWPAFENPAKYNDFLSNRRFVLATVNVYTYLYWKAFHAGGRQYAYSQYEPIRLLAVILPFCVPNAPALQAIYACCPYLQKKDSPRSKAGISLARSITNHIITPRGNTHKTAALAANDCLYSQASLCRGLRVAPQHRALQLLPRLVSQARQSQGNSLACRIWYGTVAG